MRDDDRSSDPTGQAGRGSIDVHTEDSAPRPQEARQRPRGEPLGYSFDPSPRFIKALIRGHQLRPIDGQVLDVLLRYRKRLRDSCWCAKKTVADELGCDERTVQRSLDRLTSCPIPGRDLPVIEQVPVAVPDPDEPRNITGWRIKFLWLAPEGYRPGPGPDRPGKGVKRGPRADVPGGRETPGGGDSRVSRGETNLSPGGRQPCLPGGETAVSPKDAGASNGPDGEMQLEKTPSSSSCERERDDDDVSFSHPSIGEAGEGVREVVEAFRTCFGDAVADEVAEDAERIGRQIGGRWDQLLAAVYLAKDEANGGKPIRKPIRYPIGIVVKDFAVNGVSAEAEAAVKGAAEAKARLAEMEATIKAEAGARAESEKAEAREALEKAEAEGWSFWLDGPTVRFRPGAKGNSPQDAYWREAQLKRLKPHIVELLKSRGPTPERPDDALPEAPRAEPDAPQPPPAASPPAHDARIPTVGDALAGVAFLRGVREGPVRLEGNPGS